MSYFEHNRIERGEYLVNQLLEGKNVALVSDAGTPGISDPGRILSGWLSAKGYRSLWCPDPQQ